MAAIARRVVLAVPLLLVRPGSGYGYRVASNRYFVSGGLRGLGSVSAGSSALSPTQIAQIVSNVGFPASLVPTMTAVALRESAGNPTALNMGSPARPEQSYGLFQINVGPGGNAALVQSMGYTPADLTDPVINAKVAYAIYGGNPANLNTAWLVNQPYYGTPGYTLADYLPTAEAAASQVTGLPASSTETAMQPGDTTSPDLLGGASFDLSSILGSSSATPLNILGLQVDPATAAIAAAAVLAMGAMIAA